ncbi:MAG TPA: molybdopterin-guanine dinucleotide biosynthesis protein B [Candidatus Krumholzibacteriaceae bacterium]|nr:molybdopterin-guanine dinucleotide biosynthesis protein B [Candidatus Krumholzibacteriaceae bacterium]
MTPPKTVAVVGFKDSGKTRVVEALVGELTRRGYRVGTLKHTAENIEFDTPGKDTARHREAGAVATAILRQDAAAFFIDGHVPISDAARALGELDILIIEGFKTVDTHARILVPREDDDIPKLRNGLGIAAVKIHGSMFMGDTDLPVVNLADAEALADIVEEKAYPMLPGVNCHGCGYEDCRSLGEAILRGEADAKQCVRNSVEFTLRVNDETVPLGGFVQRAFKGMLVGFLRSLKGVGSPRRVEIAFEVEDDE